LTTIVSLSTSSLIFLLNNYFLAVVGQAKDTESQSFQVLEKHPRLFKITESRKAHNEGLSKFVQGTPIHWSSQESSSAKCEGLYKSWQSTKGNLSVDICENTHP
jgi:hypothetical protein